jgi:hypothetical protein
MLALHEKVPSSLPRSLSPDLLEGFAIPAPSYSQTSTVPLEAPPALEEDGITLFNSSREVVLLCLRNVKIGASFQ